MYQLCSVISPFNSNSSNNNNNSNVVLPSGLVFFGLLSAQPRTVTVKPPIV